MRASPTCPALPQLWVVSWLVIRAEHTGGKGQMPDLIWIHQTALFFGHGLWPLPQSTFSQRPDSVSQGVRGQFLKELTQVHYHYWKGHSKVRVPGEGLLGSSLAVTEYLIYDTKDHLSDKCNPLIVKRFFWSILWYNCSVSEVIPPLPMVGQQGSRSPLQD
jgi:hypothetical protein